MAIELRAAAADDLEDIARVDARAFGNTPSAGELDELREFLDLSRFTIATDGAELVAVAGSFAMDMTLPGGVAVPCTAVTWVSVAATHRRQGILRRLMDALHRQGHELGEPLSALGASEGGIYGRFGYGVASTSRSITIDARRARLRPDITIPAGAVRFVEGAAARDHMRVVFDAARRLRPTEVSRDERWWDRLTDNWVRPEGAASPMYFLAHPEGYAAYRIEPQWNDGRPAHRLVLRELHALGPDAHRALWATLLAVDLVGPITTSALPLDDPLPDLLTDARVIATTNWLDDVWVRPADPVVALAARTYGTDDGFTVAVDGRRLRVEGGPAGATCRPVRTRPDLELGCAALGSLLLGGTRLGPLVAAGLVTARSDAVLRQADRFFLGDRAPHCQTRF